MQVKAVVLGALCDLGAPQASNYKHIHSSARQGLFLVGCARNQADLYFQFECFHFGARSSYFLGVCCPGKCLSTEIKSRFAREFKPGPTPKYV